MVSMEDLELLNALEDRADEVKAAKKKAHKEKGGVLFSLEQYRQNIVCKTRWCQ